jgi:hypothetical protein
MSVAKSSSFYGITVNGERITVENTKDLFTRVRYFAHCINGGRAEHFVTHPDITRELAMDFFEFALNITRFEDKKSRYKRDDLTALTFLADHFQCKALLERLKAGPVEFSQPIEYSNEGDEGMVRLWATRLPSMILSDQLDGLTRHMTPDYWARVIACAVRSTPEMRPSSEAGGTCVRSQLFNRLAAFLIQKSNEDVAYGKCFRDFDFSVLNLDVCLRITLIPGLRTQDLKLGGVREVFEEACRLRQALANVADLLQGKDSEEFRRKVDEVCRSPDYDAVRAQLAPLIDAIAAKMGEDGPEVTALRRRLNGLAGAISHGQTRVRQALLRCNGYQIRALQQSRCCTL